MSKTNSSSCASSSPAGPIALGRLGLYGGSFDPIHHGHLLLARDALESLALDRVVFIPAALSPHKTGRQPVSGAHRWALLQLAIEGEPRFGADDCELRRAGVSYTIDTVRHYRELHPGVHLFYFIGEDNLPELHTWRDIEALGALVTFVVLARQDGRRSSPGPGLLPGQTASAPHLPRRIEISSSEIRKRVASGLSIRYMVPDSVMHYLNSHLLYVR